MRRSAWIGLLVIGLVLLAGCGGGGGARATAFSGDGRLRVATSIYPLYEFARAVGGDRVDLVNLVPPGTEPHDWEPTAGHLKTLNEAEVFLYNGAGFEQWVDKALASLDNPGVMAVETSSGFGLLAAEAGDEGPGGTAGHGEGEEGAHDHGDLDPHVWLDPEGAIHTVRAISDAFAATDPDNAAYFQANAAAYTEALRALDQEFESGLTQCTRRTFLTTHAAFGYLARAYGLTQHAILGLAPEGEPSPRALKAVVDEARANDVRYIFFETLVSDKVARVVAEEIGAQTLVLNPFEGLTAAQVEAGEDYISIMRQNLANLRLALECR